MSSHKFKNKNLVHNLLIEDGEKESTKYSEEEDGERRRCVIDGEEETTMAVQRWRRRRISYYNTGLWIGANILKFQKSNILFQTIFVYFKNQQLPFYKFIIFNHGWSHSLYNKITSYNLK